MRFYTFNLILDIKVGNYPYWCLLKWNKLEMVSCWFCRINVIEDRTQFMLDNQCSRCVLHDRYYKLKCIHRDLVLAANFRINISYVVPSRKVNYERSTELCLLGICINTLRPRQNGPDFADDLSNAFSEMKMLEFRLKFNRSLFLRFQLTTLQHWFR